MAYTKKLATIVITTLDGGTFNVADTLECPAATSALASLQNSNGAYVKVGDDTYYIPSSAVANIQVTYTDSEEIEKADPYGCESEGGNEPKTVIVSYRGVIQEGSDFTTVEAIYSYCESGNAENINFILKDTSSPLDVYCETEIGECVLELGEYCWHGLGDCETAIIYVGASSLSVEWD